MTIDQWASETRAAAAHPEHPWDKRALEWELTPQSVVVDVGGYKGRWALQMAERYAPRLYVFEPQPWAAQTCVAVLGERATVLPYALGVADGNLPFGAYGTDGCSMLKDGSEMLPVREAGAAFAELGLARVDVMLMNIEGYEYTLIPHMLAQGIRPQTLILQRHGEAALPLPGYKKLWDYGPTLQAWRRR